MKKNVAFIIPTLRDGGAERVLSNMSINLNDDIDQSILVWDGEGIDYPYKGKLIDLNLVAYDKKFFGKLIKFKERINAIRKYKRENNIRTTISHLEGPNMVNIFSRENDKIIICVHNFQSKERIGVEGIIYKFLMSRYYNRADLIVAVSKNIKIDLVNNFNLEEEKIKVIYNPFDIKRIEVMMTEELDKEHEHIFKKPVIINVGRLTNQKAQWHLIKAFSKVRKSVECNLVILGQGELENDLKTLVKKLGIEDSVFFLGFQNNPFKFIHRSKIFALTSLFEGFPMGMAEAMACGTAVISTDCKSGPREMLAPSTDILYQTNSVEYAQYGVLCPNFNDNQQSVLDTNISKEEEYLSEGLKELVINNDLRDKYSKDGRERVSNFDVKKILMQWEEII